MPPRFKKMSKKGRGAYLERKQHRVASLSPDGQRKDFGKLTVKQAKRINTRLEERKDRRLGRLGYEDVKDFREARRRSGKPLEKFVRNRHKFVERQRVMDDPNWMTMPQTMRNVLDEGREAAQLQYAPVRRQLRDEIRTSRRQHDSIDAGYDLYTRKIAELQRRQQALSQGAVANVAWGANQARAHDASQIQNLQGAAQQDAAQRGASAAAPADAAQASRARQMLDNSWAGLLAHQGVSAGQRLLGEERIGEGRRLSAHAQENAREGLLREKQRELKSDRGAFLADWLAKARENERRYLLERQVFGLQKKEQKAEIADKKRDDKRAMIEAYLDAQDEKRDDMRQRIKDRWDMTDDQFDNAIDRAELNRKSAKDRQDAQDDGDNGPTDSVRRGAKEDWEGAKARAMAIAGNKKLKDLTVEQIASNVESKSSVPYAVALAAAQRAKRGGVDPKLARKLRKRYGLKVKVRSKDKPLDLDW